jgi:hypothetical protein
VALLGETAEDVAEAQRELVRIGIDRPAAQSTAGPNAWTDGELVSFPTGTFADLEQVRRHRPVAVLDLRRGKSAGLAPGQGVRLRPDRGCGQHPDPRAAPSRGRGVGRRAVGALCQQLPGPPSRRPSWTRRGASWWPLTTASTTPRRSGSTWSVPTPDPRDAASRGRRRGADRAQPRRSRRRLHPRRAGVVYLLDQSASQAITGSLVVVGVISPDRRGDRSPGRQRQARRERHVRAGRDRRRRGRRQGLRGFPLFLAGALFRRSGLSGWDLVSRGSGTW